MTQQTKNIFIGIVIGIVLMGVVSWGSINFIENHDEKIIKEYKEYLVDGNLIVFEGVDEDNKTVLAEVFLLNIIQLWASDINNQAIIVNEWITNDNTREIIKAEVCTLE